MLPIIANPIPMEHVDELAEECKIRYIDARRTLRDEGQSGQANIPATQ